MLEPIGDFLPLSDDVQSQRTLMTVHALPQAHPMSQRELLGDYLHLVGSTSIRRYLLPEAGADAATPLLVVR